MLVFHRGTGFVAEGLVDAAVEVTLTDLSDPGNWPTQVVTVGFCDKHPHTIWSSISRQISNLASWKIARHTPSQSGIHPPQPAGTAVHLAGPIRDEHALDRERY